MRRRTQRRADNSNDLPFSVSPILAANVATMPLRSPLRYPGGKTWLIPHIREWLRQIDHNPRLIVEPFCGGAIVSLTAVMEMLAERCIMIELDRNVAAVWHAALRQSGELCEMISKFNPTIDTVRALMDTPTDTVLDQAFRTLVYNRTRRGGILASGASFTRTAENGKGIAARWYPDTLIRRLRAISAHAPRINFLEGDGLKYLATAMPSDAVLFIDPPYTAGGKRAGRRLYSHHQLDHKKLFKLVADSETEFMMTYDAAPEIISMVQEFSFSAVQVTMKTTHHTRLPELIITRQPVFE